MKGKVNCTCGWSWNKSDSSKKDMYICHECGRDNSNNIPKAQVGIQTMSSRDKRGVELLLKETENAKQDKRELQTTGQIKNPRSIEYKKQKKELDKKKTYVTQDNRTDYERAHDDRKGKLKEFNKNVVSKADVVTDLMQLGNFVPLPQAQLIGKIGNIAGAAVDAYQAGMDFNEGNYGSGALNLGSAILPSFIQGAGYTRNMYNTNPGSIADKIASLGNRSGNYIHLTPLPHAIASATTKGINYNRAVLGALGAETVYDITNPLATSPSLLETPPPAPPQPFSNKTIQYYNTDPKKGEVEKPGQSSNVQYVPISNSEELKRWKQQNSKSSQESIEIPQGKDIYAFEGKKGVVAKNGGWLDNYNDSQTSAPEGMVGDGFSNVGRNYSPAWGGQFQEGGEIPMAQNGKKVKYVKSKNDPRYKAYQDSLNTYNKQNAFNAQFLSNFKTPPKLINADLDILEALKQGYADKNKIVSGVKEMPNMFITDRNSRVVRSDDDTNWGKHQRKVGEYFLQPGHYTPNSIANKNNIADNIFSAIGIPLDTKSKKHGKVVTKGKNEEVVREYTVDPNYGSILNKGTQTAYGFPHTNVINKNIKPIKYLQFHQNVNQHHSSGTNKSAMTPDSISYDDLVYVNSDLPYYKKPQEEIIVEDSDPPIDETKDVPVKRTKIKTIQNNLQSKGLVLGDFNIEAQLPQIRQQVEQPEYYDVTSQRQTMSGPSDYYNYNKQKMNVDDAVRAAESAEAYNKYIEDKYGNEEALKNPKAQERLKQLRQDIQVVPQAQDGYRMGTYFDEDAREREPNMMEETYDDYNTGMTGMMKSKIGMGNAFGHPAIKRMSQAMPKTGMTPEGIGTHYMSSVGSYAVPELQDLGEEELTLIDPDSRSKEAIRFNSPEEAQYFAEHYKEVAPMSNTYKGLQEYAMGGSIPGSVGFTYARTKGIPSEGPYAKKTMPSAQNGIDMYGNPITAIEKHRTDINRSYYDPRLNVMNFGTDYNTWANKDKLQAHENYHASQYDNSQTNYDIAHHTEDEFQARLQKKPSMVSTDDVWENYHDRKEMEIGDIINNDVNNSSFLQNYLNTLNTFAPSAAKNVSSSTLYNKLNIDNRMYDIPGTMEGDARHYENTGKKSFKNGGWLDGYDVAQGGTKVEYGTPEYTEAYNKGEVVTEDGQRSPILLDEVTIQNNYKRPRGFWEQSRDKYLKDNADASLLGAIGSVVTYPASIGQHALTYGIEGKVQDPSEAWGHNTKEGWFDSAGAFGRNLDDTLLNVFADPANLIGAGILTKENALSKLGKIRNIPTSVAPELLQGLRTAGPSFGSSAENITSQDLVNSINEQLAKGLGIKKQDVPLAVSLMKDEKGFLNLNTHIGDELSGSINLRQNQIKPKTFMENILGRKINTPIEQFDNTIGYSKYSDYPFGNMKRSADDIISETNEWVPKQYYNSGISGEFNSAINETLKSKGLGNLLSTRSGLQSTLGKQRWDKLVEKELAEPIGEMHYKMKKDGGIIKDDRGQWDHPGEITEINSNDITMEGVPYDVLGVSDTGDTKLMKPGKNYKFKGKKVTEFPMAKNGLRQEQKGLQNLDNLTNFTNYNKPQPGGWLNKYN